MSGASLESVRLLSDLDRIPGYVFAIDLDTREVVYRNPALIHLLSDASIAYPAFDERFLSIRAHELTIEGKRCIVHVATTLAPHEHAVNGQDVRPAISEVETVLRREMQGSDFFREEARNFHETMADDIISLALDFYKSSSAHFVQLQGNKGARLVQYGKGEPVVSHLPQNPFNHLYQDFFFRRGYSLVIEDTADFACFGDGLADVLVSQGIRRTLNIPCFVGGALVGVLAIANPGGEDGKIDFFFADYIASSIGNVAYRAELYRKMYIDATTRFPWSNAIESFYADFVASHKEIPIAIVEFDFLHFRILMRTYGASIGNEIMAKTASILREKYPTSLLARINGSDGFLIVTTGIAESLSIEAQRIANDIQAAFPSIMMTLAFGIYQIKDTGEDFDYSMLKASFAKRYAREDPLNRIKIFDEAMNKKETMAVHYANNFRRSLENGDFEIYIQPKYNLESETYFGGEALVRWKLDGKMVPPGDFIPQFEANGLCLDLDLYVLRKACEFVKGWLKDSPEAAVPLSVNFSRVDFSDPHLFESILFIINEVGIPASYIEIEITESAYVDYEQQIISFIQKCHAAGMKVLMDDFGSGISSFNSLKNLDIDCIKLDYKFLSGGGDNLKKRKIIEGIVALARAIRLPVVIEGIETKTEAAFFRALGVRYVQGYLFGKPMPFSQFEEIRNRKRNFFFDSGDDSRLMLHEFLDTNSNLNFFFDTINLMAGIFRFDGTGLYPMLINKKAEQAVASFGVVSDFLRTDLLQFFSSDKRGPILECLANAHNAYVFSERKTYEFHFGAQIIPIYMQGLLLQTDHKGNRIYLLTAELAREEPLLPLPSHDGTLDWLLRTSIQGCAVLNEKGIVLAYNDYLKKFYPLLEEGIPAEDVFHHRFDEGAPLHRAYLQSHEIVFDVTTRQGKYKGQKAILLIFSELGNPGSYIAEIGGDGFKFYDRLISTAHTIAVCYVEIDLETDSFFQINFAHHDDFAYHDAVNHGSYTGDLYQRFLASVSQGDYAEIAEKMRLDKLVEACKAMSPFILDYKLSGGRVFHRLHMRFYFDRGHHYACFYLEDISLERARDYDPLTKCLGRTAGIARMDRYIEKHPLDKMAFFILDLDDFKKLNDTYGHPVGDRVLAKMRDVFDSLPPEFDFGTRLGGDEFCIFLTKRGEDFDVDATRSRIDEAFHNVGYEVGLNKSIRASIGCALLPEDGSSIVAIYPKADGDLYNQKKIHKADR